MTARSLAQGQGVLRSEQELVEEGKRTEETREEAGLHRGQKGGGQAWALPCKWCQSVSS